jgi:hypothetical protein
MTPADMQTYFIEQMIAEMNATGFINGVYAEHECRRDHLYFIVYSLDPKDRHDPYLPVRMHWDDVVREFRRLNLYHGA